MLELFDGQQRDVEGAAAHVIDQNIPLATALLVQAIGNRCSHWLVEGAQDIHARDRASVLGRLALGVIEVGRNSNDCVVGFPLRYASAVSFILRRIINSAEVVICQMP